MANNLKKIRTEKNLTQGQLAELSGVSRQTIIKLEGEDVPPIKTTTLVKIADALGFSVADVFFN